MVAIGALILIGMLNCCKPLWVLFLFSGMLGAGREEDEKEPFEDEEQCDLRGGWVLLFFWHHPALLSLLEKAAFPRRTPPRHGIPVQGKAGPIPAAEKGGLEQGNRLVLVSLGLFLWPGSPAAHVFLAGLWPGLPWAPCPAPLRCPAALNQLFVTTPDLPTASRMEKEVDGRTDKRALSFGWEGLWASQGFLAGDGGEVWEKFGTCLFWVIQRQKIGYSKA